MKKILGRKGFTLVECIIAVAVFGLLSIVIFMILTNASVRSAKASESEENLAQLIENVVGDDTYKRYEAPAADGSGGSPSLELTIDHIGSAAYSGTNDFKVSYNVISGYKNFIECHPTTAASCGHRANFTEFMSSTPSPLTPVSSADYNVHTCYLVCPYCGEPQQAVTLKCPDCDRTGAHNASSGGSDLFHYMNTSAGGGFECGACGSTAVMAVDSTGKYISEKASAGGFSVSGMVANGIRYGETIDWTTEHADDLTNHRIAYFRKINPTDPSIAGADFDDGQLQLTLKYEKSASNVYTGSYELNIYANPGGDYTSGDDFNTDIVLPIGYNIVLDGTNAKGATVTEGTLPGSTSGKKYPILRVTSGGPGTVQVKFALSSKETGYSFEYENGSQPSESDDEQGLFRWFGLTPTGIDRDEMNSLKSANGSGFIFS